MQLCKIRQQSFSQVGCVRGAHIVLLDPARAKLPFTSIGEILQAPEPQKLVEQMVGPKPRTIPFESAQFLAPIDRQEVWAAGVTYKRSKVARESESAGAASFYDKVYTAARPELFFKATPNRVTGPGDSVRVRGDSQWTVPEPELALYISSDRRIAGFSIANDMSARDIEGENPLYLPQAKIYCGSCALGPVVTVASAMPPIDEVVIEMKIERAGELAFSGATRLSQMARTFETLVDWLFRENVFQHGVVLLTGTGIVPPDEFTLHHDDLIRIAITGIGELVNPVL